MKKLETTYSRYFPSSEKFSFSWGVWCGLVDSRVNHRLLPQSKWYSIANGLNYILYYGSNLYSQKASHKELEKLVELKLPHEENIRIVKIMHSLDEDLSILGNKLGILTGLLYVVHPYFDKFVTPTADMLKPPAAAATPELNILQKNHNFAKDLYTFFECIVNSITLCIRGVSSFKPVEQKLRFIDAETGELLDVTGAEYFGEVPASDSSNSDIF